MLLAPWKLRAVIDAEKIQGSERAGNFGAGDLLGRRRWADLRRFCRRSAGVVSGNSGNVRGHARGRSGTPRSADRHVPAAVWRAHSADPSRERKGLFAAKPHVAGAAAGRERGAKASGSDGDGGPALLPKSRSAYRRRVDPRIAE